MSEDLIRRSDAIKAITDLLAWHGSEGAWVVQEDAIKAIKDIPTLVTPSDRPQGEWIPFEYGDERWHKCTACGVADRYIEYVERPNGTTGKLVAIRNYCPNCGARMKGADDEYERAVEQMEYDMLYEPTYNPEDGSM